jgi:hypothetical protein
MDEFRVSPETARRGMEIFRLAGWDNGPAPVAFLFAGEQEVQDTMKKYPSLCYDESRGELIGPNGLRIEVAIGCPIKNRRA